MRTRTGTQSLVLNRCFNSLQTGRHMRTNHIRSHIHYWLIGVSIPSKREGTCEQEQHKEVYEQVAEFQFPPNGKAHANNQGSFESVIDKLLVSIPSKREGTCERWRAVQKGNDGVTSFNSLQTGRHMRTRLRKLKRISQRMFQFPPNGKAHANTIQRYIAICEAYHVSIPSKREGTCELQTEYHQILTLFGFQFPPNGKAHANMIRNTTRSWRGVIRFNSLQTGRHMRT